MKSKIETRKGFPVCSNKSWDGESVMLCPVRHFEFSHTESAGTLMGTDDIEAKIIPGTEVVGKSPHRRSAVVINFDGECGHKWRVIVQQYKGQTFVTTEYSDKQYGTKDYAEFVEY